MQFLDERTLQNFLQNFFHHHPAFYLI